MHLKIAAEQWTPLLTLQADNEGKLFIEGPMGNILQLLTSRLNITHTIKPTSNGLWSRYLPNDSWTGMVGMLLREEVDIALGPTPINYERAKVVEFASPILISRNAILTRSSNQVKNGLTDPFVSTGPLVWVFLVISVLVMILICVVMENAVLKTRRLSLGQGILLYSWKMVRTAFQKNISRTPAHLTERIVTGFFLLSNLILTIYLAAIIHTDLVAKESENVVDSLENLLEHNVIPMFYPGSDVEESLENAEGRVRKALWDKIQSRRDIHVSESIVGSRQFAEKILGGKCAFFSEYRDTLMAAKRICEHFPLSFLHISTHRSFPIIYALIARKTLPAPFKRTMNDLMYDVRETGLFDLWLKKYYGTDSSCLESPKYLIWEPIRVSNIRALFIAVLIGFAISIGVLIMEVTGIAVYNAID